MHMTGQKKDSEWRPADCHSVLSVPGQRQGDSISFFGGKRTGTGETWAPAQEMGARPGQVGSGLE